MINKYNLSAISCPLKIFSKSHIFIQILIAFHNWFKNSIELLFLIAEYNKFWNQNDFERKEKRIREMENKHTFSLATTSKIWWWWIEILSNMDFRTSRNVSLICSYVDSNFEILRKEKLLKSLQIRKTKWC